MNSYEFFANGLVDVAADQTIDGGVPHVVPDIVSGHSDDDWLLVKAHTQRLPGQM
jgi:alpha-L-rhamnosidase